MSNFHFTYNRYCIAWREENNKRNENNEVTVREQQGTSRIHVEKCSMANPTRWNQYGCLHYTTSIFTGLIFYEIKKKLITKLEYDSFHIM